MAIEQEVLTPCVGVDGSDRKATDLVSKIIKAKDVITVRFENAAYWNQDNPFIRTGYRPTFGSYTGCYHSLFAYWHNETVNVWTHLIASITALCLFGFEGYRFIKNDHFTTLDGWGILVFLLSAFICLGFSSTFHTLLAHSEGISSRWNKLDYIGIAVLISGSFVPYIHFGFYCDPHIRNSYLVIMYGASLLTVYVLSSPRAKTPSFIRARTAIFISLGLSGVFPICHALWKYGLKEAAQMSSLKWVSIGGALYIAGAVVYAERIPERWLNGQVDLVGSSHQLFHVLIMFAAWAHYKGCLLAYSYRHVLLLGSCS